MSSPSCNRNKIIRLEDSLADVIELESKVDILFEEVFLMHDDGEDDYVIHENEDDFVLT